MTELFRDIESILKQDPKAIHAVRRVLKNNKDKHKDANSRDLNSKLGVAGHKFVKR
jgi:hypothetical protein